MVVQFDLLNRSKALLGNAALRAWAASPGCSLLAGTKFHPSAGWDPVTEQSAFACLTGFSPSREGRSFRSTGLRLLDWILAFGRRTELSIHS
jgi:hypothetical protein